MSGFCHVCYFLDGTKHESTTMVDVGEYDSVCRYPNYYPISFTTNKIFIIHS